MNNVLYLISNYIEVFLLVLTRTTSLFIISPIFGRRNMSNMVKIGLGFMIALIITPALDEIPQIRDMHFLAYMGIIIKEFAVGLILGFITYITFSALYIAGQIIDMQIGFGMVNVFDHQSNIQVPVIANLYTVIATLMFLSMNGHHMIISSIFYSYKIIPIGSFIMSERLLGDIIRIFADAFVIGFKIAAPVIATIFITDVVLGILARTIPQMNVFVVGMPLKIIIGMFTLVLSVAAFSIIMEVMAEGMYRDLETVIKDMVKR
ncbi:MAG: flagellar type III secretion system protein FliR [Clostridiaceae bacterium]|nr:flagellar type III secretion system protein FliR [Clostridiaceae bacterium]